MGGGGGIPGQAVCAGPRLLYKRWGVLGPGGFVAGFVERVGFPGLR